MPSILVSNSHASRHKCPESLKFRHPNPDTQFPKGVIPTEIAVAYGRRAVPKLVAVLRVPDLPAQQLAECLTLLNSLLTSQEGKVDAVNERAAVPLVRYLQSPDASVRQLSCQALASLALVLSGRASIMEAGGVEALSAALSTTASAAAACLEVMSANYDGAVALLQSEAGVIAALVQLIKDRDKAKDGLEAAHHAIACLTHLTALPASVDGALQAAVPRATVQLAQKAMHPSALAAYPATEDIRLRCARCLQHLCQSADGKVAVLEAAGLDALALLCSERFGSEDIIRCASAALASVTVQPAAKVPAVRLAGAQLDAKGSLFAARHTP
ncbi:hypothetical protein WJX72_004416 [[Myrmecia] bisecta]|uniref:Uncharacterized protein n=1 Tax=[Myrmecia] bisecta TaxID=41462 RepID=A0AAW1Q564_9CHLO